MRSSKTVVNPTYRYQGLPSGRRCSQEFGDPRRRGRHHIRHRTYVSPFHRSSRAELHRPRHELRALRRHQQRALRRHRAYHGEHHGEDHEEHHEKYYEKNHGAYHGSYHGSYHGKDYRTYDQAEWLPGSRGSVSELKYEQTIGRRWND